jgi:5-methyltetrahydrofolate--homocysteine methyltransferase
MAGGCCGTTPEHIAMIAERVGRYAPRVPKFRELAAAA